MAKKPVKKAKTAKKARNPARKPKFRAGKKTPRLNTGKRIHAQKAGKHAQKNVNAQKAHAQKKKIILNKAKHHIAKALAKTITKPISKKSHMEAAKPTPKPSRARYKFLEHTADIMVLAQGKDFETALQQAGLAMFSVLGRAKSIEAFEIEETARTRTDLVVYVLARILSECDVHELVPARFDILEYDEKAHRIKAQVWGERIRPKDAIKAVTYHLLEVKEEKGLCFIQVVFDV